MGDTATPATATDAGEAAPATGEPAATPPATGAPAATATGTTPSIPELTPEQVTELIASNERMAAALKEANREAQNRRQQATEAERAKMTAEEQSKAELEELRGKAEEWQVEKASILLENEVSKLSIKMGIVDPDVMVRLIDWEDLSFDDEGRPTNTEAVVQAILKDKPFLLSKNGAAAQPARPTGADAGAGQGSAPAVSLTAAEMAAAQEAGLTPERYQALKGVQTLDQWKSTRRTGQGN